MKTKLPVLCIILLLCNTNLKAQNKFPSNGRVGIATTSPNTTAILDIDTTGMGVLLPRMSKTERDAIASPANGLLIFQTNNTPGLYYYDLPTTVWVPVSTKAGANKTLSNLTGLTAINQTMQPDLDDLRDLGTDGYRWRDIYFNRNLIAGDKVIYKPYNFSSNNEAFGFSSGLAITAGTNNTFFGSRSGQITNTGSYNTAVGAYALFLNTSGSDNSAFGYQALLNNTTGTNNTAIGLYALLSNTTGSGNTASGNSTLYTNTTGINNTANGESALYSNTIGSDNTATGLGALLLNTTGVNNTAIGSSALRTNTVGVNNTANGYQSLYYNTTGSQNNASGSYALAFNTTGEQNIANGYYSLAANTTGDKNTAVGYTSLVTNTTGSKNTAIGANADVAANKLTNATAIGYSTIVDQSNHVRIGNTSVNSIGGQVAWTNFSDGRIKKNIKENVPGLTFINLLKPVTYNFNLAKQNELLGKKDTSNWDGKNDIEKISFTGFVAQDVDDAAKKINYDFSGVDKTGKIMGLRYTEFIMPLVKGMQELSKLNDDKDNKIIEQQKKINELEGRLSRLEEMILGNKKLPAAITLSLSNATLDQNIPNPFSQITLINYSLPLKYNKAQIVITDINGKVLKQVTISGVGKGSFKLDAATFPSGAYYYSLIIDGKLIRSNQMECIK